MGFKISILTSDLQGYSDVYIVVKGTKDLLTAAVNENDKAKRNGTFKNNAPFRSCISKSTVHWQTMQQIVMLLPSRCIICLNIVKIILWTSGSLWIYYRDDIDNINVNASDGKSFK